MDLMTAASDRLPRTPATAQAGCYLVIAGLLALPVLPTGFARTQRKPLVRIASGSGRATAVGKGHGDPKSERYVITAGCGIYTEKRDNKRFVLTWTPRPPIARAPQFPTNL
jgi:hypothetical protein